MPETKVDGGEGGAASSEPPDDIEFVEVDPTGQYGRYNDVLGKGAYKTVYRAFDEVEGIEVAWNQVRVDELLQNHVDLERLYSEMHLLKTVKHKNIIKFYNSWVDDKNKTVNIITEIFTSGTLRQYRKKHKHVDMKAVKGWARQVLWGLLYLHSHNPPIIHRDIKCDNIFVNGNHGEVKIGDLGLATILQQTPAHSVIGTPEFMAPELYEEDYNELVDIYSFGMCLLEMVTFEYPYSECNNPAQIFKKVTSGIKPAALYKIKDPQVRAFIEKCLVAAPQRLPARELLMDPFLQCDGGRESIDHMQVSPSITPQAKDVEEASIVSGAGPSSVHYDVSSVSNDVTAVSHPPLESGSGDSDMECMLSCGSQNGSSLPLTSLEVQSLANSKDLILKGKKKNDNIISLIFRIADLGGHARNIKFKFYLDSDTAFTVASEMIEQLDLSDQDVTQIAELIDTLIARMVPSWKPGVSIDETVDINEDAAENVTDEHSLQGFVENQMERLLDPLPMTVNTEGEKIENEISLHDQVLAPESTSAESSLPIRCEGNMHGRFEEFTYNLSGSDCSPTSSIAPAVAHVGEVQASQVSLTSEAAILGSLHSVSENIPFGTSESFGCSDVARMDTGLLFDSITSDSITDSSKYEICKILDQDLGTEDQAHLIGSEIFLESSFCPFDDNSNSVKGREDSIPSLDGMLSFSVDTENEGGVEDEELRTQLELIELQYQYELQELARRRQQSVDEIRRAWNEKKKSASAYSKSSGSCGNQQNSGNLSAFGGLEPIATREEFKSESQLNVLEKAGNISLIHDAHPHMSLKSSDSPEKQQNSGYLSAIGGIEPIATCEEFKLDSQPSVLENARRISHVYDAHPHMFSFSRVTVRDSLIPSISGNGECLGNGKVVHLDQLTEMPDTSSGKVPVIEPCSDTSRTGIVHTKPSMGGQGIECGEDVIVKTANKQFLEYSRNKNPAIVNICRPRTSQESSSLSLPMDRTEPIIASALLNSDSLESCSKVLSNGTALRNQFSHESGVSGPIECEVMPCMSKILHRQSKDPVAVHSVPCLINKSNYAGHASFAEQSHKEPSVEREKPLSENAAKLICPPAGPKSCQSIKLCDPVAEQQRKEQLEKSIAELQAKTVEGFEHSNSTFFIGIVPMKNAGTKSIRG